MLDTVFQAIQPQLHRNKCAEAIESETGGVGDDDAGTGYADWARIAATQKHAHFVMLFLSIYLFIYNKKMRLGLFLVFYL